MPSTIDQSFIDQWGTEIKLDYQQKKAKLRDAIKVVSNVGGATHKFHKMAPVVANTKTRGADLDFLFATQSIVTATLTDHHAALMIDDLDEAKTNADVRRGYVETGAASLARKTDEIIVAAMDTSNSAIPTATGAFTYARFVEAMVALEENEVEPEDRCLVVSPYQLGEAMAITQLTNADYLALNAIRTGGIGEALGFKWIISNRLTTDAVPIPDAVQCYAFSKSAVGLAIGKDVQTRIDYSPDKAEYVIDSKMSMGAVVIDPAGVVQMKCDLAA